MTNYVIGVDGWVEWDGTKKGIPVHIPFEHSLVVSYRTTGYEEWRSPQLVMDYNWENIVAYKDLGILPPEKENGWREWNGESAAGPDLPEGHYVMVWKRYAHDHRAALVSRLDWTHEQKAHPSDIIKYIDLGVLMPDKENPGFAWESNSLVSKEACAQWHEWNGDNISGPDVPRFHFVMVKYRDEKIFNIGASCPMDFSWLHEKSHRCDSDIIAYRDVGVPV